MGYQQSSTSSTTSEEALAPGHPSADIVQPVQLMDRAGPKQVEILVVEDNPGDVRLTREALRESKIGNRLDVVSDGVEALAFLRREGRYVGAHRPDLILLDLNLPRKDGREVLEEIQRDSTLRDIPVVVVTSSRAEADACRALQLGAAGYVAKPVEFGELARIVQAITDLWIAIVKVGPGIPPTPPSSPAGQA